MKHSRKIKNRKNEKHLLVINFKTYKNTVGGKSIALAKKCASSAKTKKQLNQLVLCPTALDAKEIAQKTTCSVFAQHLDPVLPEKNTGFLTAEHARAAGLKGTLLNHAEHKLQTITLKKTLKHCKKSKLATIVCAANLAEIKKLKQYKPDYIAYEPPELIGGTISVSKANPDIIKKAKALLKNTSIKLLCGAGIKTGEDAKAAIHLGCNGVLVASGVVLAKNPGQIVKELLQAMQ